MSYVIRHVYNVLDHPRYTMHDLRKTTSLKQRNPTVAWLIMYNCKGNSSLNQPIRGPFLESPGNFSGPDLYFKIKIYKTLS